MSVEALSGAGFDYSSLRALYQSQSTTKFEEADTDQSGGLSLAEFEKVHAESQAGAANSAGTASAEEVFSALDVDGDGQLTSADQSAVLGGSFSPETFMSLLSAQESSAGVEFDQAAARNQISSTYGSPGDSENDLVGDLLDTLDSSDDEEKVDT